ncbi:hypothetical protein MD484_g956, partial [Candolleomyces efflorescens]
MQPQPQRRRVPQSVQAPQQAQLVQNPQLGTQYLLAQQIGGAQVPPPSLTPAMVMNGHVQNSSVTGPAAFFLLPPSTAIPPVSGSISERRYQTQHPSSSTQSGLHAPFLPAVGPAQAPNTVRSDVVRVRMREEEERDAGDARNNRFMAVPTPPAAPQPVPASSAVPSPAPQQVLTQFQPTPSLANAEQTYDFDQPSAELSGFPDFDLSINSPPEFPIDFAQDFGYSGFEDQWQQAIDFGNMPQVTLYLSMQQQQDFVTQAQTLHPQINGRHQLSNHGPEEDHLGTLHQQQVTNMAIYLK